jgi:hypothetical protein
MYVPSSLSLSHTTHSEFLPTEAPHLKWQRVEANSRKLIHQIDKIDNFQGLPAPLIRFRASFEGPCYGDIFAAFKMDLEQRKRWDTQIKEVYEIYPLRDLDEANIAMGFGKFGDCQKIGIGYCKTKGMPAVGITPREQLTLCGVQQFIDGSTIIWGTEMEDSHNHLFPSGKRLTRSKTHLFSVTLTPSGPDTFDIEYAIQLEIGGNLPQWLTTPIMYDTIKRLFTVAQGAYRGKCDTLELFVKEKEARESSPLWHGLLMTP